MKHNYVFIKPHADTLHTYVEGEGMLAAFLGAEGIPVAREYTTPILRSTEGEVVDHFEIHNPEPDPKYQSLVHMGMVEIAADLVVVGALDHQQRDWILRKLGREVILQKPHVIFLRVSFANRKGGLTLDTAISKRITLDVLPRNFRRRATVKHLELIPDFWAPTVTSGVRIAQTQLLPVSRQHQAAARHQGRRK